MAAAGTETPRVLVTRKMMPDVERRIAATFRVTLNPDDRPMTRDEILRLAAAHDGLLLTSFDKLGPEFIPSLPPSIRIIATHSVGYDHLSIPQAEAKGIAVTNTPGVLTDATADIALLLMLGAARGASWGDRMVREDRWGETTLVSPMGLDVSGQRLGILGMGRIGQAVARRARAFGMAIHYHARRPVAAEDARGAAYHARFADMLPNIDFLSVNCASTPETRGMVNAEALALLPKGAIVVNTARGDIVEDDALIAALASGHLAAAGLDVFKGEPRIDPRYRGLDNVFLLPHIGSATPRTRSAMGHKCIDNLEQFFRGERPADLITRA
ncbi:MAG: D-glycerate dehydrogenase [Aestuariivirga sp.]|uniref:2-hydroxyacid dehydrogenase n=1 Tax=Aestuariivirga sp. TaxID=2650926 RepID=UPI0025C3611D|nr:D-glycerate dehydrogenase [Aestuariivirga sp.]MCA3561008.1 D-glycerate dehydrogenase [Aestuariivirga sp.]